MIMIIEKISIWFKGITVLFMMVTKSTLYTSKIRLEGKHQPNKVKYTITKYIELVMNQHYRATHNNVDTVTVVLL